MSLIFDRRKWLPDPVPKSRDKTRNQRGAGFLCLPFAMLFALLPWRRSQRHITRRDLICRSRMCGCALQCLMLGCPGTAASRQASQVEGSSHFRAKANCRRRHWFAHAFAAVFARSIGSSLLGFADVGTSARMAAISCVLELHGTALPQWLEPVSPMHLENNPLLCGRS